MRLKNTYLVFFSLLLFVGCQQEQERLPGKMGQYYPPVNMLTEGIVYKYYDKKYDDKNDDALNISYTVYHLIQDTLLLHNYDAGFDINYQGSYLISGDSILLHNYDEFYRRSTENQWQFTNRLMRNWGEKEVESREYSLKNSFFHRAQKRKQIDLIDTIYESIPAVCFTFLSEGYTVYNQDTTTLDATRNEIFSQNRGLVYSETIGESSHYSSELVEQMSIKTFEKLRANNRKRVGFIDPVHTILPDPSFSPCTDDMNTIYDYYNGDPAANLIGKKGAKWEFIEENLDDSLLFDESGYLSVHFVVNCEGKIGRFTVEQADLDYQKKTFPKQTIDHLIYVTKTMKPWQPCVLRNQEKVDCYAYLTYKIENGTITEILP